jgi:hypothetical protein
VDDVEKKTNVTPVGNRTRFLCREGRSRSPYFVSWFCKPLAKLPDHTPSSKFLSPKFLKYVEEEIFKGAIWTVAPRNKERRNYNYNHNFFRKLLFVTSKVAIPGYILWHICSRQEVWSQQRLPSLGNRFANKHVCTATTGNSNRGKVFSVRYVPRCYKLQSWESTFGARSQLWDSRQPVRTWARE